MHRHFQSLGLVWLVIYELKDMRDLIIRQQTQHVRESMGHWFRLSTCRFSSKVESGDTAWYFDMQHVQ